jgi:hypothetical protein
MLEEKSLELSDIEQKSLLELAMLSATRQVAKYLKHLSN